MKKYSPLTHRFYDCWPRIKNILHKFATSPRRKYCATFHVDTLVDMLYIVPFFMGILPAFDAAHKKMAQVKKMSRNMIRIQNQQ